MIQFVGQALKRYKSTGAVAPSSRRLAMAMTRPVVDAAGPRRILEVGPGTGAFTRHVLQTLRADDEFHIVEINDAFCEHLETRLLRPFRRAHPTHQVTLHQHCIEDAPIEGQFDFIVCGLPFNNFPLQTVRSIFRVLQTLLADDGMLSYFEYVGMSSIKRPVVGADGRRSLRKREHTKRVIEERFDVERRVILANIPPAYAVHLRRGSNGHDEY